MQSVSIRDVTSQARVSVDEYTSSLTVIDSTHREGHLGNKFMASHVFRAVADGTTAAIIWRAHGVSPHVVFSISAGGDAIVRAQAGLTIAGSGTSLTTLNKNGYSSNLSGVSVLHTPTITSYTGTTMFDVYVPGGSKNFSVGGVANERDEFILPSGTSYAMAVRNISGGAINIGMVFLWYEV